MKKNIKTEKENFDASKLFFTLDEEKITISKRKYETLIEEVAYLRGKEKTIKDTSITISLIEYENLINIKGRYLELKGMVLPNTFSKEERK